MTASKFLKCGPKFYSIFINGNKVIENGTKWNKKPSKGKKNILLKKKPLKRLYDFISLID